MSRCLDIRLGSEYHLLGLGLLLLDASKDPTSLVWSGGPRYNVPAWYYHVLPSFPPPMRLFLRPPIRPPSTLTTTTNIFFNVLHQLSHAMDPAVQATRDGLAPDNLPDQDNPPDPPDPDRLRRLEMLKNEFVNLRIRYWLAHRVEVSPDLFATAYKMSEENRILLSLKGGTDTYFAYYCLDSCDPASLAATTPDNLKLRVAKLSD